MSEDSQEDHEARLHSPEQQESSEPTRLPPSHARLFRVAAGLQSWSAQEQEWIKNNPNWIQYEKELRQALEEVNAEMGRAGGNFAARLQRKPDTPPATDELGKDRGVT